MDDNEPNNMEDPPPPSRGTNQNEQSVAGFERSRAAASSSFESFSLGSKRDTNLGNGSSNQDGGSSSDYQVDEGPFFIPRDLIGVTSRQIVGTSGTQTLTAEVTTYFQADDPRVPVFIRDNVPNVVHMPDTDRSFSIPRGNTGGSRIPSMNQTPVRENSDPYISFQTGQTGVQIRDPNSRPLGRTLPSAVNRDTRFSNRYPYRGFTGHSSAASNSSNSSEAALPNNQQGRQAVFVPEGLHPYQHHHLGYLYNPLQNPWINNQQSGQFEVQPVPVRVPMASRTSHPLSEDQNFLSSFLGPVDDPFGMQISNLRNTLAERLYHTAHTGQNSNLQNTFAAHPYHTAGPGGRGLSFSNMDNHLHPYHTASPGEGGLSFSHMGNRPQPYHTASPGEGGLSFSHMGNRPQGLSFSHMDNRLHPYHTANPGEGGGSSFSHMGNRPQPYHMASPGEGGLSFSHMGNRPQPYHTASPGEGGLSFSHMGNRLQPNHTATSGQGGLLFSHMGNRPHSYHTAIPGSGGLSFSHMGNDPQPYYTASPGEGGLLFSHMGNLPQPYHTASPGEGGLSFSRMGNRPQPNHIASPGCGGLLFSQMGNRPRPYHTASPGSGGLSFSHRGNRPSVAGELERIYRDTPTTRPMVAPIARTTVDMTNQIHLGPLGSPSSPPDTCDEKCSLCHIKVSYWPPGSTPFLNGDPPQVAILPCQHVYHEHCLDSITPKEQATDPPCLVCAKGQ